MQWEILLNELGMNYLPRGRNWQTSTALEVFVIAMLLYPDVMRKAQDELDNVVGRSRPPSFEDKTGLPYIRAVVQEVLRWRPVVPLGALTCFLSSDGSDSSQLSTHKAVPHRSTEVLCPLFGLHVMLS